MTPHLEHTLRADELIVRVDIPAGDYTPRSHYLKVRDRESYEFALVSAAVALHVDDGVIRAARVAAGGVGTVPWRLHRVEGGSRRPAQRSADLASWRCPRHRRRATAHAQWLQGGPAPPDGLPGAGARGRSPMNETTVGQPMPRVDGVFKVTGRAT
jgi:CO/xanthine dehydrogenase FAD-binding subunit